MIARAAVRSDRDAVAATLANAFEDDPFTTFAFPDLARRRDDLYAMFCAYFDVVFLPQRHVLTVEGCGSVAVWTAPGTTPDPAIEAELGSRLVGALPIEGLARAGAALDVIEGEKHPHEPHWYLEFLGTDPAVQGRGLAGAVLAPVLARCDAEGIPAYLWTAKEQNLAFYGRHGFAELWAWEVPDGPRTWGMWRDPRTSGPQS